MKKILHTCFLFLLFQQVLASHSLQGGYISYQQVTADTFDITMTLYRQCNGIAIGNSHVIDISQGSLTTTLTVNKLYSVPLVNTCPGTPSNCSGGTYYGIEEWFYKGRISLAAFSNASPIQLSFNWCCYDGAIAAFTGGTAGLSASLMKGYTNNPGPLLANKPTVLMITGIANGYSARVSNANGDSMVYEMKPASDGTGGTVTYTSPYVYNKPFQYQGMNIGPMYFSANGQLRVGNFDYVIPTAQLFTLMFYKISRFRAGVKIGETEVMHPLVITSNSTANSSPKVNTASTEYNFCAGTSNCIQIYATDDNSTDSTYLTYDNSLPGATFSTNGMQQTSGSLCWTPQLSHVRSAPYYVNLKVVDNHCPIPATSFKTIAIYVKSGGNTITAFPQKQYNYCQRRVELSADTSSNTNGYTYQWAGDNGLSSTQKSTSHVFSTNTWNYYSLRISHAQACGDFLYHDSVFTPVYTPMQSTINNRTDTVACTGTAITLQAIALGGKQPFSYSWNNTAGTASLTYTVTASDTQRLKVTDSVGCSSYAYMYVKALALPIVSAGNDVQTCELNSSLNLTPFPTSGTWNSPLVSANSFNITQAGAGTHSLVLSYTNLSGCTNRDTVIITVNTASHSVAGSYPDQCRNSVPLILAGSPQGGVWSGPGVSGNGFFPQLLSAGTYNLSYKAPGCYKADTVKIKVNPFPAVNAGNDKSMCQDASAIILAAFPAGGSWTGKGTQGFTFNPATAGIGQHKLVYTYVDNNSCSNRDTLVITVLALPATDAGADRPVCANNGMINLSWGSPAGGSWSGSQVSNMQFNSNVTPGVYQAVYNVTQNTCSKQDTVLLKVVAAGFNSSVSGGKAPVQVNFSNTSATEYDSWLWDFGDPQSGSNNSSVTANPSHTYTQFGQYTVRLTAYSSAANCSTVVEKNKLLDIHNSSRNPVSALAYQLYPNPAAKYWQLRVSGHATQVFTYALYDIRGQLMQSGEGLCGQELQQPCTGLSPGVYMLHISNGAQSTVARLSIQ